MAQSQRLSKNWLSLCTKRDGTKEIGRELMESGAHVKSYNHKSIGIAMIGGVVEIDVNQPEDNFTEQQWLTLKI